MSLRRRLFLSIMRVDWQPERFDAPGPRGLKGDQMKTTQRIGTVLRCGTAFTAIAIAAFSATVAEAQANSAATTAAPPAAGNPPSTNPQSDINTAAAVNQPALQPAAA